MKRENVHKILYALSALFFLAFAVTFGIDAYKYSLNGYLGSAPLEVYLLIRTTYFFLPSLIFLICAIVCQRGIKRK